MKIVLFFLTFRDREERNREVNPLPGIAELVSLTLETILYHYFPLSCFEE
jgi:hypothetical protein